jgi:hypothetical protein
MIVDRVRIGESLSLDPAIAAARFVEVRPT